VRYTQLAADAINARGGVLGGRFESSRSTVRAVPQERSSRSRQPSTRGFALSTRATVQMFAGRWSSAVNKHNNATAQSCLYLNTGAVDPALNQRQVQLLHFRFDADGRHEMAALTDAIAQNGNAGRCI